MSGPQNAIVGDDSFGTDLPQSEIPTEELNTERNMAKFSQSKEFQKLKEHLEQRIEHWQQFLPGNIPPENVPDEERGKYWAIANVIINEFRIIIQAYEQAFEVIKEDANLPK